MDKQREVAQAKAAALEYIKAIQSQIGNLEIAVHEGQLERAKSLTNAAQIRNLMNMVDGFVDTLVALEGGDR